MDELRRTAPSSSARSSGNVPLILHFSGTEPATSAEVGGKAAGLIRMSRAGLPVPAGAVLTSSFFSPWFDEVKASREWTTLQSFSPDDWSPLCNELKVYGRALPLGKTRRDALDSLLLELIASNDRPRFAVRSTSPEEDLASASFAGMYETRLSVPADELEEAVRHCFASSLDARVLAYKRERGLDEWSPALAVIVQQQIDSEVAGVAFSLNPVTNDYDEVVIDANLGLGTSVVEGSATPDHFVINRVERQLVEATLGDKRVSIWSDPAGGTVQRMNEPSTVPTLSEDRLHELSEVVGRIETLYDTPVDVEWAYAEGRLHVLQARPITRFVPLPPAMITPPGERRRLYMDAALSKGLTTNEPVSSLGLDAVECAFSTILESWFGTLKQDVPPAGALHFFDGGRMYVNLSNLMWLASPRKMSRSAAPNDVLMATILAGVDAKRYRSATRPPWLNFRLLWMIPRVVWNLRRFLWNVVGAVVSPDRIHREYRQSIAAFEAELREEVEVGVSLSELRRHREVRLAEQFDAMMSVLVVGLVSPDLLVRRRTAEERTRAERLKRGVAGNVVVQMGIELYRLSRLLDPSEFEDVSRLAERIEQRDVPPEFLGAWDAFLEKFGFRGPNETDLASPRYADDPHLALRQMSFMATADPFDPEAAHDRRVEERRRAYEEVMRSSGPLRRALLRRICRLNDLFAGTRDTPKHLMVLSNYGIRRRALANGRRLVREGRLDAADHVFDLTFDDLAAAADDSTLDLRMVREERSRFHEKLDAHVISFPAVIDSRGRILRPPPTNDDTGLLSGMAVSPGVVTGPVKVLHTAGQKPIEKGDILVAYTTDPGWTPLFVNAGAIVLEVGGVLQHGAVVAREFGKPCVVGIDRIVAILSDGEIVEVDGTAGTVRRRP